MIQAPSRTVPVVKCPAHTGHAPRVEVQCGRPITAFDTVTRMESIHEVLCGDDRVELIFPDAKAPITDSIRKVHRAELVDFLENAWATTPTPDDGIDLLFADTFAHPGLHAPATLAKKPAHAGAFGQYCFDTITGIGPRTFDAAIGSVGCALTAAGHVAQGAALALALCRPPGHHVSVDAFGGGCYLNNAAISTQWLRDHGAERVAIIDVDFHHGNGTQAIFYERPDVFYASLHGDPDRCYPYFTGHATEVGSGPGRGSTMNLPFGPAIEGAEYLRLIDRALTSVSAFGPDFLVVSLGFDTFSEDPAGDAALDRDTYHALGRAMAGAGIPILAILEGGYAVPELGRNVQSWLSGALTTTTAGG